MFRSTNDHHQGVFAADAANTLNGVGHNQLNTQQNSTQDRQEYAAT
jgi:hypothetical protein